MPRIKDSVFPEACAEQAQYDADVEAFITSGRLPDPIKPSRVEYLQAIIRGDLPFPDEKPPEPPCCIGNAWGGCAWECERWNSRRLAYQRIIVS